MMSILIEPSLRTLFTVLLYPPPPLLFSTSLSYISLGWDFPAPVDFLERYLTAKRAVENKLVESDVRSVVLRPSLIWTKEKPAALVSVIPFYILNKLGVPIIDRPMDLDILSKAAIQSVEDETVEGVKRYSEMDNLCERYDAKH